jgi:hypothetical protein
MPRALACRCCECAGGVANAGEVVSAITSVVEVGGKLLLGNLQQRYVGEVDLQHGLPSAGLLNS